MRSGIVRFEVVEDEQGFSALERDWESLCEELKDDVTVFASFAWYQSWWRFYGAGARLHLVTMRQGDRLTGIAPLLWKGSSLHGLPVRMIGFIQNNQSLHNDFIVLPEFRAVFFEQLLQALFARTASWDVLYFRNMPVPSENRKVLSSALEAGGRQWRERSTPIDSPYLVPAGGWQAYLAGCSARTRKSLRNIKNKIFGAGHVSVMHLSTWEEFLAFRDELFDLAQRSWTERVGDSLGSAVNRDFFEALAFSAAAKGWLSIWVLCLDGKVIAAEFHLKAYGREHALRGHYDPAFASLSPGTFLEMAILEHLFEEPAGVRVYDFCGSFDQYKRKWTESSVPHRDLFVFNGGLRSQFAKLHEFKVVPFLRQTLEGAKRRPRRTAEPG